MFAQVNQKSPGGNTVMLWVMAVCSSGCLWTRASTLLHGEWPGLIGFDVVDHLFGSRAAACGTERGNAGFCVFGAGRCSWNRSVRTHKVTYIHVLI